MRQLLLLSLLLWCSAGTFAQPRYVDAHIHWDDRANFVEDLVRIYRKNSAVACLSAQREEFDALKAAAKKHPDVIIPFYWIDLDDNDVLAQIDRAHTAGFKGLKIHSPLKNYDDPSYFPAFARAERYRLVALLHTGISSRPTIKSRVRKVRWRGCVRCIWTRWRARFLS